jgi:hypothetical protein
MITDCKDCAVRWSCSLESDGPQYTPCPLHKDIVTIYDPPSGWRYGFPKVYKPLPGESFRDTLFRDGYPEEDIELAEKYSRFWEENIAYSD